MQQRVLIEPTPFLLVVFLNFLTNDEGLYLWQALEELPCQLIEPKCHAGFIVQLFSMAFWLAERLPKMKRFELGQICEIVLLRRQIIVPSNRESY